MYICIYIYIERRESPGNIIAIPSNLYQIKASFHHKWCYHIFSCIPTTQTIPFTHSTIYINIYMYVHLYTSCLIILIKFQVKWIYRMNIFLYIKWVYDGLSFHFPHFIIQKFPRIDKETFC